LQEVLDRIDEANAKDPNRIAGVSGDEPAELLYGRRMSACLAGFAVAPSEALQIAVRGQHVERWKLPRSDYPDGKQGYLAWRREQASRHAGRLEEFMAEAGYEEEERERAASLVKKRRLKNDPEAQMLEDVACLVFLEHYAPAFISRYDDAKVKDILVKTARKMSPQGLEAAGKLTLDARLARLLAEALGG
jgi:hypothetical protein